MIIVIAWLHCYSVAGWLESYSDGIMEWVQIRDDCIRLEVSQQEKISSRKW